MSLQISWCLTIYLICIYLISTSEIMSYFCNVCHYNAIYKVMMHWIALQRSIIVYEYLSSRLPPFCPIVFVICIFKTLVMGIESLMEIKIWLAEKCICSRVPTLTKAIFRHPTISATHSIRKSSQLCDLTNHRYYSKVSFPNRVVGFFFWILH